MDIYALCVYTIQVLCGSVGNNELGNVSLDMIFFFFFFFLFIFFFFFFFFFFIIAKGPNFNFILGMTNPS